jgi:hypothetical protein
MASTAAPSIFKNLPEPHMPPTRHSETTVSLFSQTSFGAQRDPFPPDFGAPGGLRFKPGFFTHPSFSHLMHYTASSAVQFFLRTQRDVADALYLFI